MAKQRMEQQPLPFDNVPNRSPLPEAADVRALLEMLNTRVRLPSGAATKANLHEYVEEVLTALERAESQNATLRATLKALL